MMTKSKMRIKYELIIRDAAIVVFCSTSEYLWKIYAMPQQHLALIFDS
jgi:hypothetical protein